MSATLSTSKLFRGENYGVFTGPNGYYVAVSHYQPANGGGGYNDNRI